MDEEEEEKPRSRAILLVPAGAIVAVLIYLFVVNPSASDFVSGAPTATAAHPSPSSPARVIAATPTASPMPSPAERLKPASLGRQIHTSPAGYEVAPKQYQLDRHRYTLTGLDEWVIDEVPWGVGPPSIQLVAAAGDHYRFHVDGFAPTEWFLPDRTQILFNIAGIGVSQWGIKISAARTIKYGQPMTYGAPGAEPAGAAIAGVIPGPNTGVDLEVEFNHRATTMFGPTFQVSVSGVLGSEVLPPRALRLPRNAVSLDRPGGGFARYSLE